MATEVGVKLDSGKVKAGVLAEFHLALLKVGEVGTFGADKYARGGWKEVDNGLERYWDAMWRHLLTIGNDEESGLPHLAHFVWNALAVLQLELERGKNNDKEDHPT